MGGRPGWRGPSRFPPHSRLPHAWPFEQDCLSRDIVRVKLGEIPKSVPFGAEPNLAVNPRGLLNRERESSRAFFRAPGGNLGGCVRSPKLSFSNWRAWGIDGRSAGAYGATTKAKTPEAPRRGVRR